jgi:hypothetical protein
MITISHIFLAALLTAPAAAQQPPPTSNPSTAPCVPEGSRVTPDFDRPPLGQPGDPVGAEWVHSPGTADGSGDPQMREKDSFSGDDPMGTANPSSDGSTASAPIDNDDGDLSGPNGEDQNGGSEGPCIEVYVEWTYRYPVTIHKSIGASIWGFSSGEIEIVVVWKYAKKRAKVKEICPC